MFRAESSKILKISAAEFVYAYDFRQFENVKYGRNQDQNPIYLNHCMNEIEVKRKHLSDKILINERQTKNSEYIRFTLNRIASHFVYGAQYAQIGRRARLCVLQKLNLAQPVRLGIL